MELQRRGDRRRRDRRGQQDARRLVHPPARPRLRRLQRERQAGPRASRSVPQFPLTVRERDNSPMDQYTNTATTDDNGAYDIREAYPLGKWLVLEAFDTRYRTTGITYKGENETRSTTKLGGLVDLDFLPIIGLGGEVDWGVQPYDAGHQRRHRRHRQLRHDPQRARPGRCRLRVATSPASPTSRCDLYATLACTATDPAPMANQCRQGKADRAAARSPDPANPARMIDNPADGAWCAGQGHRARGHLHLRDLGAAARLHGPRLPRRPAHRPEGAAGVRRSTPTGCASRRR